MTIFKVFIRSFFINVFQNEKNMQNFGFVFAMKDILKETTNGVKEYYSRLLSYFEYISSNPFFVTAIIGLCINLERKQKTEMIGKVKIDAMSPIAALADAMIWGTLKPALTVLFGTLALLMFSASPFFFWLFFILVTNFFRWYNLLLCEKMGLGFLFQYSKMNLQEIMLIVKRSSMIYFGGFLVLYFSYQFNMTPILTQGNEHFLIIAYFILSSILMNKINQEFSLLLFMSVFIGYYYIFF